MTEERQLNFANIDSYQSIDENLFNEIQINNKPALFKCCQFGDCLVKWNLEYLTNTLKNKPVVIHESRDPELDFITKNFKYRTCSFSEFSAQLKEENPNSYVYLRSINTTQKPARIEEDFPMLKEDFQPPNYIPFQGNRLYHSSVLRIASSNVQVWTHFDLYDNVLCQVVGTKRVILFPPSDIQYLYIKGDKSQVNQFDDIKECLRLFPLIGQAKPYKCLLRPGDVLFIPALWWHNIRTYQESESSPSYSIGFNIFWRDSLVASRSQYAAKDVYGNRNLTPFESALTNLNKAIEHLDKLPEKYRFFYKYMLLNKLETKIFNSE